MEGRKQTNMDLELQNTEKWNGHFFAFCVYMCGCRENPSKFQPKRLTHLVIVFSAPCLRSCPSTVLNPCLIADWPAPRLGFESLTLLRSLAPDRPMSFVLFSGLAGFRRHSSLYVLSAKIDKGAPLNTLTLIRSFL